MKKFKIKKAGELNVNDRILHNDEFELVRKKTIEIHHAFRHEIFGQSCELFITKFDGDKKIRTYVDFPFIVIESEQSYDQEV